MNRLGRPGPAWRAGFSAEFLGAASVGKRAISIATTVEPFPGPNKDSQAAPRVEVPSTSPEVLKVLGQGTSSRMEEMKARTQEAIRAWQVVPGDTGSAQVQVAALTVRIDSLTEHMRENRQDKHSKKGLQALIMRRRKLMQYMKRKDFDMYRTVVQTLQLPPVRDKYALR